MAIDYLIQTTTFGRLLLAAAPEGLLLASFADDDSELLAELTETHPDRLLIYRANSLLEQAIEQYQAYCSGQRSQFSLPIAWQGSAQQQAIWHQLIQIPYGQQWSYQQLAELLPRPYHAAYAINQALRSNPLALIIPCHRLKSSPHGLGYYRWGRSRQQQLLAREAIPVTAKYSMEMMS
ncbi:methylated-DNA--[protein]-cysteine S-methyltransferase [Herpetosiphon llansteffanensis]|uniref:methylated-DNA--[protein]-cysteine S-methyltransferase n=1 Tax=Herpetosiphon llansteffanensis TaxID=2094568 RepID=UPI000D7C945B|nr:methylated-DNA--[protein]-cysteine S-methyltransferase [Herpetosiphon llansteffanensis]